MGRVSMSSLGHVRKGPPQVMGLDVRTNAPAVAAQAKEIRHRMPNIIAKDNEARAIEIQNTMRREAGLAYTKAATGRFSRGIFAKVAKSQEGDTSRSVIRITMVNYRESVFLTNIGGTGYFDYPTGEYKIWAKGAREVASRINAKTQTEEYSKSSIMRAKRVAGVGRLKVPRRGKFFTAARQPGRGGGESRIINDSAGPAAAGTAQRKLFFYPLVVTHPGFDRDPISEVAAIEIEKYKTQMQELVKMGHQPEPQTGQAGVVSREIPIPQAVSYSRGKFG